ncbi:MAG: hypothetical protein ACP5OA_05865 [Candidatus Woesearchaeota archaeon]
MNSAQKTLTCGIISTILTILDIILLIKIMPTLSDKSNIIVSKMINFSIIIIILLMIASIYYGIKAIKNKDGKIGMAILGMVLAVLIPLLTFIILVVTTLAFLYWFINLPPGTSL